MRRRRTSSGTRMRRRRARSAPSSGLDHAFAIVRMDAARGRRSGSSTKRVGPKPVSDVKPSLTNRAGHGGLGGPRVEHDRQRLQDRFLALLVSRRACSAASFSALDPQRSGRAGPALLGLALDLVGLQVEFDEHRHLRAQHEGVDRLEHHVHRAGANRPADRWASSRNTAVMKMIGVRRGCARPADQLGGLVAVHPRHVQVEQDDRELVLQQLAQRRLARARPPPVVRQVLQRCATAKAFLSSSSTIRMRGARRRRPARGRQTPAAPGASDAGMFVGHARQLDRGAQGRHARRWPAAGRRARCIQTRSSRDSRSTSTGLAT